MSKEEFTIGMKIIYNLFPNTFSESRNDIYYETFKSVSNESWLRAVVILKDNVSKFPMIPEIKNILTEHHLWPVNNLLNGIISFVCENASCKEGIVTRKEVLLKAIKEHRGYECPKCKAKYKSQYILDHRLKL